MGQRAALGRDGVDARVRQEAAALPAFAGVGIEIEYAIVDRASLDVRPLAGLLVGHGERVDGTEVDWSNELVAHVAEIKNPRPVADLAALPAAFACAVRTANERLALRSARLLPTGMHPWMDPAADTSLWHGEGATIYATFDRLFDCRRHGWANLQSMHVNLPFAGDDEFARLHAAVRVLLPLIPALAASSPYAGGRLQPALDQRLVEYRDNSLRFPEITGAVIPDNANARDDYERHVLAPIYRAVAPVDPAGTLQHEWLNARGAIARFDRSALEIRVCDAQECPRADLAIAALLLAVTHALYEERWSDANAQRAVSTADLAAILGRTVRDADAARIEHPAYLALFGLAAPGCTARDAWHALLDRCGTDALAWNPQAGVPLALIDARGPLARRLVRALGAEPSREALRDAYRELADCLAADRPYDPA
jgi:carboxylate-amine ligase